MESLITRLNRQFDKPSLLLQIVIAAGYFFVSEISIVLSENNASTAIVWPAAGVAFAVVLYFGVSVWPAIAAGSLLANTHFLMGFNPSLGKMIAANTVIAIANVIAPIAGRQLILMSTREFNIRFDRRGDIFFFALPGAISAAVIAALGGVGAMQLLNLSTNSFLTDWYQWFISDLVGTLIVAPVILLWLQEPSELGHDGVFVEGLAITILIGLVSNAVFGPLNQYMNAAIARPFLLVIPLIWAAARFTPRATATWNLMAFVVTWFGTSYGYGQLAREGLDEPMVPVQLFLGTFGFTNLLLCAVVQEKKQARKELEETNRNLEERVAERTQSLLDNERRLIEAKNKAEKATELKNKFVSLISHDLRGPISSAIRMVHEIEDYRANPNTIDIADNEKVVPLLRTTLEGSLHMIDSLLDISRLQTGRLRPVKQRVSIRGMVDNEIEKLRYVADKKNLRLLNRLSPSTFFIVDPSLFSVVINNLLNNAVKYCRESDEIVIAAPSDSRFQLLIEDTGIGMDDSVVANLFRPGLEKTTHGTAGEPGTGLGLLYCHDIIRAHRGTIEVNSSKDRGTTVSLKFPEYDKLVLLVDATEDHRPLLNDCLERLGRIEIIESDTDYEALELLKTGEIDLVIIDESVACTDAATFTELIRESRDQTNAQRLPILTIRDGPVPQNADETVVGSDVHHIQRPFVEEKLVAAVRKLITTSVK